MARLINRLPYILCYVVAFALGMKQLREPDIWWQLLSGRWMLQHHQVTHADPFSYTMAGHPWINVKWLYEIIIGALETLTGPLGVLLLQCFVNVAIVWFLFRSIRLLGQHLSRPVSGFFSVIAVLLFLSIVEYRMAGRPEMFSHLFCAVYLYVFLRAPRLQWKSLLWLIPLQCLWCNMHEGYPVGLVMIGTLTAGNGILWLLKRDKSYLDQGARVFLLFIATVVVILLNPNGMVLWRQPFEIYRQVWANKYTTELYSFTSSDYWTIQAKLHVALLLLTIVFWSVRLKSLLKDKTQSTVLHATLLSYTLLVLLFGYLSLTANRNIPFAQIILLPSVPFVFSWLFSKAGQWNVFNKFARWSPWLSAAVAVLFYMTIVTNNWYKATGSPNRYGFHINVLHNPVGAANFIKEHHITGIPFSDYFVSSYLLWDLYPNFRSYIDLRDLDVFPIDFFDRYFQLYDHTQQFAELDKKYNFNYVVVSTSQLLGLQHQLYWQAGYNMVYVDPVAVIFLKQNEINKPLNNDAAIQKPFTWPDAPEEPGWAAVLNKLFNPTYNNASEDAVNAPVFAAIFYKGMQDYPQAIKILQPALPSLENEPKAFETLSGIYTAYSKVTSDPRLRQMRQDSARMYLQGIEKQ